MKAHWGRLLLGGLSVAVAGSAIAASEGPEKWLREGRKAVERARALHPGGARAKNVILFIGDGMDLSTITAARILEGQFKGGTGESNRLAFEELPYVALAKTYNTNQQVPDSAGTMTAILTGAKTRAGVVGLDERATRGDAASATGHELRNLFQDAEQRGLATGIVTTTRVTHATPAAVYAHTPERNWEDDTELSTAAREAHFPDIARQLVEPRYGDGLDVVLGGGQDAMEVTTTSTKSGKFEARFFHMVFAEEFGRVKGHFGPINTLAFHPNGTGFASGSEDGYIRLHKFDADYFKYLIGKETNTDYNHYLEYNL